MSAPVSPSPPPAPIAALADQCVRCGLCLPHCPTYAVDRVEAESPRGRIALAAALAAQRLDPAAPEHWQALDHCLGCRRCEAVCPAGVRYGELLVQARHLQRSRLPPPRLQRLLEWLAAHPRLSASLLSLAARVSPLLPRRWRQRLPAIPHGGRLVGVHRAHGTARGRVGLFLGCFARRLDVPVHRAAIAVLTRLGWDVVVPSRQTCCGALHRHAGNDAEADMLAARNRSPFAAAGVHVVLSSASGCFDGLRAGLGDVPCSELLAFVAADACLVDLPLRPSPQRIALHVPCTQASVVGAAEAAAQVLARIPGLDARPVAATGCCGAAGSHMLLHPSRAAAQRAPLLAAVAATGAAQLASANIGCRLHLQAGLTAQAQPPTVRHPIELLAEALT